MKGLGAWRRSIQPWFIALTSTSLPVLFYYVKNIAEISIVSLPGMLTLSLVGGVIFLAFAFALLQDGAKAAVWAAAFGTWFFYYGDDALHADLNVRGFLTHFERLVPGHRQRMFLLATALILGALGLVLARAKRGWPAGVSNYLAVVGLLLLGMNAFDILQHEFKNLGVGIDLANPDLARAKTAKTDDKRDVYYFIFDRYTGPVGLQVGYEYDNRAFLEELRRRGFYVADRSFANYPATTPSLASSLNASYLTPHGDAKQATTRLPLYERIQEAEVPRFLQKQGYRYVQLGSWWWPTQRIPQADQSIPYAWRITVLGQTFHLREFTALVVLKTPLRPLLEKNFKIRAFQLTDWGGLEEHGRYFQDQMNDLRKMPEEKGPKFIFAHILMPHAPYIFDRDGSPRPSGLSNREAYLRQLEYTNREILTLMDRLIYTKRHPIIILSSDEGEYPPEFSNPPDFPGTATDAQLLQKLSILNAYYLPESDYSELYPTISPVNSFRIILNQYFGTHLSLLPDRSYTFTTSAKHMLDWTDVTDRLRKAAAKSGAGTQALGIK